MSNTIQLKRSSTASDTPTASDLAVGELAVNTADGKLFTKHTDNSIVEIEGIPANGILSLTNTGSQSEVRLYCESNNAHYASLKAPAHADFSGNVDLTLPTSTSTLLSTTSNLSDLANVSSTAPSSGEVLKWNGSAWSPAADATGSGGGNADTVDNKHIAVVSSLPSSPDSNTIYFIT